MEVLVIGGGASGLMAALTASERPDCRVLLLERQARVGRKLLATGNGRCNLTNRAAAPEHYHGEDPAFCLPALTRFGVEETLEFFRRLGLLTVTEPGGRVYPYSDSANSVVDVLRLALEQRDNVWLHSACEVVSLRRRKGRFSAESADGRQFAGDKAIVCAGGAAGSKLGGTDWGYRLLSSFGHSRTGLYPSLVQLRTETAWVRALKGVRCQVRATFRGSQGRTQCQGELQFTEYGVSGPVVFELSRAAAVAGEGTLLLDFLPAMSREVLLEQLQERRAAMPRRKLEDFLTGMLHNRLGRVLLRRCGCALEAVAESLTQAQVAGLCELLKAFSLPVLGVMGMDSAQVTAGGVRTAQFRAETLESRLCPGLYAAGEVLDIDGDCGGYNLQWAWSSGRLAGQLK